jgi:ParB/RepB/Spo0J family partition protein
LIDADPAFNICRSQLTPADCEDLAASIQIHGQQTPVLVRPLPEPDCGKLYNLVVGFRRYMAIAVNLGCDHINAFVREMTHQEAQVLNVIENLQRTDLSFWDECRAIRAAFPSETRQCDICRELGKSMPWVKKRQQLWELPESILVQVEAGLLGPADVEIILQQDRRDRIRAANKLRAGKAAGESIRSIQGGLTNRQSLRPKKEVKKTMTLVLEAGSPTDEAAVHAMRYCTGEISDTLLYELLDKLRSA